MISSMRKRVSHFFVAPHIAADDGDAEGFNFGRLQEDEDGLLVSGGGTARVLINNYLALGLRGRGKREQDESYAKGDGFEAHVS